VEAVPQTKKELEKKPFIFPFYLAIKFYRLLIHPQFPTQSS